MDLRKKQYCDDTCCTCDSSNPMIDLKAKLSSGELVRPVGIGDRFYGTSLIDPAEAFSSGIPLKGTCIDLLRHASRGRGTRFRGTTPTSVVSHPMGQDAIYWAEAGGWVYELGEMIGWDLERLLEGRVPTINGYTGTPYPGELECSVDARILPSMIRRGARVKKGRRFLELEEWQKNKNYQFKR